MSGQVVRLERRDARVFSSVKVRLESMAAIFRAIEAGELLAALPDCPLARDNHNAALNLLGLVESEVNALCVELSEDLA